MEEINKQGCGEEMKISNQPPMKQGSPNDFQTPPEALEPLLPFLKKNWRIWECACGKGNLGYFLSEKGFETTFSDINSDGFYKKDFLGDTSIIESEIDCIITNPPFSLKQQFLEKCYKTKKPFALLLPLTTLETAKRQSLFKKYGVQIILFDKRINFETPSGKGSGSWFATAWFTFGLNLPKELNFVKFKHQKDWEYKNDKTDL